jgi:2-polyprenyl-3-methyl-5-hydroxy-6-metoxy-1,4-benzoquinol methylase
MLSLARGTGMSSEEYRIKQDPLHGYRQLDPVPSTEVSDRFYQSQYYDLIRKGQRAPDIARLTADSEKAAAEQNWLRSGLYADIGAVLTQHCTGNRLLDVGCGTGALLAYMQDQHGFATTGIEPSAEAAAFASQQGLHVYADTLDEFVQRCQTEALQPFDAITLLHVLEHIPDPVQTIDHITALLRPGGVVCIQVPNDFSAIQEAARQQLQKDAWWVAIPDHISYFDFSSLRSLLEHTGFEIIYEQGDFPMEFFLLMGDDYIGNPSVGSQCHQKRVQFEQALPADLRRRLYHALAQVGVGRSCLMFGKRP